MLLPSICCVPIGALRRNPSHEAEMISQLLFGEIVHIIETVGSFWVKVKVAYDGYEGWCQQSHLVTVDMPVDKPALLTAEWANKIIYNDTLMYVPYGSVLTGFINGEASWGDNTLSFSGESWSPADAVKDVATIKKLVQMFINTAYSWGGRSVFGVDCSGFTQTVFRFLGIALPRDAHDQATGGTVVDFLQEVRCGDLAFFDNEEGRITHVGLLLSSQEIIHAAGKVRIDKMDSAGIVHAQTGEHTHRLRIIKRYW